MILYEELHYCVLLIKKSCQYHLVGWLKVSAIKSTVPIQQSFNGIKVSSGTYHHVFVECQWNNSDIPPQG